MNAYQRKLDRYKKRYAIYRELGYSPEEAKKLRGRKLDVDDIPLSSSRTVIKDSPEYTSFIKNHKKHYTKAKTYKIKGRPKKDVYKIRYQAYREMGYSPEEARRMRSRYFDVYDVKIDKGGNVIKDDNYNVVYRSHPEAFLSWYKETPNISVYSKWGMFTSVHYGYNEQVERVIEFIMIDTGCTSKQAYYFLYFMLQYNLTYEETKEELFTAELWEMYKH